MIFVHKYKWSHENKRKKFRKLLKQDKVRLVEKRKDGFYYEWRKK